MGQILTAPCPILNMEVHSSLLANGFNRAWALMLTLRQQGLTHFLMVHADIIPKEPRWLETMLVRMHETPECEVLSAVVPIKNEEGLTSTAIDTGDPWRPRRLTTTEVKQKPVTWTEPNLLINTGLLLVDIRKAWVEQCHFEIKDRIIKLPNGLYEAQVQPEDWYFSRQLHALGVKPWATQLPLQHWGEKGYDSEQVWGHETDPTFAETAARLAASQGAEALDSKPE